MSIQNLFNSSDYITPMSVNTFNKLPNVVSGFGPLSLQVATNTTNITTLNTEVGTLNTQVAINTANITTLNTEVGTLNTQVATNTANITTLNTSVSSLQSGRKNIISGGIVAVPAGATPINFFVFSNVNAIGNLSNVVIGGSNNVIVLQPNSTYAVNYNLICSCSANSTCSLLLNKGSAIGETEMNISGARELQSFTSDVAITLNYDGSVNVFGTNTDPQYYNIGFGMIRENANIAVISGSFMIFEI